MTDLLDPTVPDLLDRADTGDRTRDPVPRAAPCPTRRGVVAGGLAGLGALCVAACSSGGDPDETGPDASEAGSQPAPESPGAADETGDAEETDDAEPGGGVLARVDDIPEDGAIAVEIDGAPALLARASGEEVAAFSAICTHQGCQVAPGDGDLACPCHGSTFALTDGAALRGPATEPLPSIAVRVENGEVRLG